MSWQLVTLREDLCEYPASVFSELLIGSGEASQSGALWAGNATPVQTLL